MGVRGLVLPGALFAASALWLVSAFLPATAQGSGAALSSHEFADLLASGALPASAPDWLGFVWYAMPVCAALLLTSLGIGGARGVWIRVGAVAVATLSVLAFGAIVSELVLARVGTGVWLASVGSACAVAASRCEVAQLGKRGADRVL